MRLGVGLARRVRESRDGKEGYSFGGWTVMLGTEIGSSGRAKDQVEDTCAGISPMLILSL